jgi:hypothetical protein
MLADSISTAGAGGILLLVLVILAIIWLVRHV